MKVGDAAVFMNTDFINITLERNDGSRIDNWNYNCSSGSVDLPETVKLIPGFNMSSNKVFDVKVCPKEEGVSLYTRA